MKLPALIAHRVNSIAELNALTIEQSCEIDLRSDATTKSLYLAHDPFTPGVPLNDWLECYAARKLQGPLILNTKEDGLEESVVSLLKEKGISSYFFLDTTFPTLNRLRQKPEFHFALRLSSLEPSTEFTHFVGSVDWLWVDCFKSEPLPADKLLPWVGKFKICLVSPELQGGSSNDFNRFQELARLSDAICTKFPQAWANLLK